jgi:tubulin-like protein
VTGDEPLDLFRFISLDTDSRPKEDEPPPGGKRGVSYSANVPNTGQAILNLRQSLGEDLNWCPQDLTIEGEGAGNLRAGGRLLLFSHFPKIWQMIRKSTYDASTAAREARTLDVLRRQYERRKMTAPADLVKADKSVVYLVGDKSGRSRTRFRWEAERHSGPKVN